MNRAKFQKMQMKYDNVIALRNICISFVKKICYVFLIFNFPHFIFFIKKYMTF